MTTQRSGKRTVNVSIDGNLLDEARRINLDLSETLAQQLRSLVKEAKEQRWRQENTEAVARYNRRVAERGLLSDEAGLLTDHEPI